MKNDSIRYPFETFGDDAFDSNKDGKLTGMETVIRDAHLDEMNRNAAENNGSSTSTTVDDWDCCLTVAMKCLFVLWVIAMIAKLF